MRNVELLNRIKAMMIAKGYTTPRNVFEDDPELGRLYYNMLDRAHAQRIGMEPSLMLPLSEFPAEEKTKREIDETNE